MVFRFIDMNKQLQDLVDTCENGHAIVNEVVRQCCKIIETDSYQLIDDIFQELSFEEIVQKLKTEIL